MGVFTVSRGKAVYLYVKNRDVSKYIRVTDAKGQLLKNHEELKRKADKLDTASKPGTGTLHLYLVCSRNRTYGYEQLVFRAQPPGISSKSFKVSKYGYHVAFLNAKRYLTESGFESGDLPNPSRYKNLIVSVVGELGYRSILKEYKDAILNIEAISPACASLLGTRRRIRRTRQVL